MNFVAMCAEPRTKQCKGQFTMVIHGKSAIENPNDTPKIA